MYTIYALHCKTESPARLITLKIPKISQNEKSGVEDKRGVFELNSPTTVKKVKKKMQELGETEGETEALASENPNNANEDKGLKGNKIAPNKSMEASKQVGADLQPALFEEYKK